MIKVPASMGISILKGWQLINSLYLHFLATGTSLGLGFLFGLSAFVMLAACASRKMDKIHNDEDMAGASDVDVLLGAILST
ncbi:hypothetical protein Tco_0767858 [Tanacetum coccineum]